MQFNSARGLRTEKAANGINQHCYPFFVVSCLQGFDDEGRIFLQTVLS